ncbi:leucine-rich repeat-containing protein 43-like [Watersipora subatra]|uniref:leucine-rich repeat-containing protein 43-like n=1 Tax=Watersipora subatra TaxID=2589382 RepID=UPI00355C5190
MQTSMSFAPSDVPPEEPPEAFFTALEEDTSKQPPKVDQPTTIIRSEKGQWSANIELNWAQTEKREDLLEVRDFLKTPMTIDVVEETILSYPKDEAESEKQSSAKKKKEEPKKDDKKGKKKKDDQDMRHEPPEYSTLASFEANLSDFLTGEVEYTTTFAKIGVQSRLPSSISQQPPSARKEKGRVKSGDKKDGKGGKEQKGKDAAEGRKKSGKKDGKKKDAPEVEADPNEPPPPLEIDIKIRIHRWASVAESVENEE